MREEKGKNKDDFPKFDLGISPMKQTSPATRSSPHDVATSIEKEKGKQVVDVCHNV